MLDSRKSKRNCDFAEGVVSYLYDEMDSTEKVEFETHLASCDECPEDLAAFQGLSLEFQEWRKNDFERLKTPEIVIPYEKASTVATVESGETVSLFDRLQALLGISPALMKTAAALSSLLIIFALGWFLLGSFSDVGDVASNPVNNEQKSSEKLPANPDIAKIEESKPLPDVESTEVTTDPIVDTKSKNQNVAKPTEVAFNKSKKEKKPVSRKNINKKKNVPAKRKRRPVKKKTTPVVNEPIDRLTEEFAIDETKDEELRLTDLLDEVGSDD